MKKGEPGYFKARAALNDVMRGLWKNKSWRDKNISKRCTPLKERFWNLVERKESGCWEIKTLRIGIDGGGGKIRASRASWKMHYGKIPKGMNVLHKCDNPPCIRPSHLFLGTQKENVIDCVKKGRHFTPFRRTLNGSAIRTV